MGIHGKSTVWSKCWYWFEVYFVTQIAEIISRFERKGFKLVAIKVVVPSKDFAQKHYHDLKERPFFNGLCDFLSSGPVVAMVRSIKSLISLFDYSLWAIWTKIYWLHRFGKVREWSNMVGNLLGRLIHKNQNLEQSEVILLLSWAGTVMNWDCFQLLYFHHCSLLLHCVHTSSYNRNHENSSYILWYSLL